MSAFHHSIFKKYFKVILCKKKKPSKLLFPVVQTEELFILQRENAEEELEFQRRRELIMEKAKPEVRTCEQGEKWSLSQVWRCPNAINVETFGMDHCILSVCVWG